ncbi:MAG: methyltransferase domain-containing protein [bacterium]
MENKIKNETPKYLIDLVKNAKKIMDIGTGPFGSFWYEHTNNETEIFGIDLYTTPKNTTPNYFFTKLDALKLENGKKINFLKINKNKKNEKIMKVDLNEIFDLVVADHCFEHVSDPAKLARGIKKILKKDGLVHIGIPHSDNFTDKFYHLIHPEGGGHISLITKERMTKIMEENGFELLNYSDWPDDWCWLESLYDWERRGVKYFSREEILFIVNVFRKELTTEKGYFYGGEYVFKKK